MKLDSKWFWAVLRLTFQLLTLELMILGWMVADVSAAEQAVGLPGPYQAIVVLGAQVKPWYEPSDTLLFRMQLALEHYREEPGLIICCGGQGKNEPMAEGDFMREWMIDQGVPPEDVVSENTSLNTRQNIANAKRIMEENGLRAALVITSDYHLHRALITCGEIGLWATGDASQSRPSLWWKNHVREAFSRLKFLAGY